MSENLLEQRISLAELLDQDALQRVCMTYSRLFLTGITVVDRGGQALVDVPLQSAICRRISDHPAGPRICSSFEGLFQGQVGSGGDSSVTLPCTCGLLYESVVIRHQGTELGWLVLGPYRPPGMDALDEGLVGSLKSQDVEKDARVLRQATDDLLRMSTMSRERAAQLVEALHEVLTVIVQTGYARHLTSQIHIAAIQDAYNELTEKNRRLADSYEKLKELDKLKSNFLATVSHELRTPLTSVIGYSELLLEGIAGKLSDEQREYIQVIMEKGDQLLQIINEVLNISRIESGNIQLVCEQVILPEMLQQVRDAMMPQARRKQIEMSFQVPPDLPAVWVDRGKARQILFNLLSNAIKFTPRGGSVEITAEKTRVSGDGGSSVNGPLSVLIRVRDTGIGIPEESRDKVFEAFYQVDSSTTREYGGTGLGLSIVKNFVEAHGGRVWVESNQPGGSVFSIVLPVNPSTPLSPHKMKQPKAKWNQR